MFLLKKHFFIKEKCYYKKKLLSMAAGATAQSHLP
jgi:hypothetical protein